MKLTGKNGNKDCKNVDSEQSKDKLLGISNRVIENSKDAIDPNYIISDTKTDQISKY